MAIQITICLPTSNFNKFSYPQVENSLIYIIVTHVQSCLHIMIGYWKVAVIRCVAWLLLSVKLSKLMFHNQSSLNSVFMFDHSKPLPVRRFFSTNILQLCLLDDFPALLGFTAMSTTTGSRKLSNATTDLFSSTKYIPTNS